MHPKHVIDLMVKSLFLSFADVVSPSVGHSSYYGTVFHFFQWRCQALKKQLQVTHLCYFSLGFLFKSTCSYMCNNRKVLFYSKTASTDAEIKNEVHTGLFLLLCSSETCRISRMASWLKAFPNDLEKKEQLTPFTPDLASTCLPCAGSTLPVGVSSWVHLIWHMTPSGVGRTR